MPKEDQKIIVVERNVLFRDIPFQGFRAARELDYESRILSNVQIMRRGDAETDPTYKQPIGYVIVINPFTKKVFAYQRSSKDKEYGEKRLQGKWSWGFGGHIEPSDAANGNPIRESVMRELTEEELEIYGELEEPMVLGYINDDSNPVGAVHFGILYATTVKTPSTKVSPKDSEIARVELCSIGKLEEMCASPDFDVETWSRITLEPLRKLL